MRRCIRGLSLLSSEVHIRIHGGGTQPAYISVLIK
ncbi:hypothetical protein FOWG_10873 [Fusarium oxysporum f. sp. lycopersici MN25]|uniref:Uncharacterized protein n=1 Tax=Fusarium oxysporum Fo47 TaxID=660027 RepID=W9JQQ2_FUSOX|nr:hypothetical protein FOZG_14335 [Fusarium oxysporum Fo47]EWZ85777.1 hypothetical protein FOWG_10873 [Fusarium oxysporum f. sp. lycopersici MN25]